MRNRNEIEMSPCLIPYDGLLARLPLTNTEVDDDDHI